jgi:hypothetical protein
VTISPTRRLALARLALVDSQTEALAMSSNVGGIDRILRIVVGLVLISLVFIGPKTAWGWIGIIPLATALIGWCPLYVPLGISSCPRTPSDKA